MMKNDEKHDFVKKIFFLLNPFPDMHFGHFADFHSIASADDFMIL